MKKISLCIVLLVLSSVGRAQDANFYAVNTIQLYNNPAFSGLNKSFSFDFAYRNQWPNLTGNFVSSVTSVNQYLGKGNGVSIMLFTDNAANILFKREINIGYSKAIQIAEGHFIAGGVQVAYFQKYLDFDKLTFGDMIDPRRGFVYSTSDTVNQSLAGIAGLDFNAGLVYYNDFGYASFSVKHLFEPNEALWPDNLSTPSVLPMLIFGELGGKIPLNNMEFIPYVRYKHQGTFNLFHGGVKAKMNDWFIELGAQYRNAFYLGFGYLGKHFKGGYNVVYYSGLSSGVDLAHELFLGLDFNIFKKENEHYFDF